MSDLILCPGNKRLRPVVIKTCTITRRKLESVLESKGKAGNSPYATITLARVDALNEGKS